VRYLDGCGTTIELTDFRDVMDDRKSAVLRAVVEAHIESAQPVGSGALTSASGLGVSSATIRNEMASLETEGYLTSPHTSSGRIPTEKGYRYFVDNIGGPGKLAPTETRRVSNFFAIAQGAIEGRLQDTSELLSSLTAYTGVIVGPSHDSATIRSVQLVTLEPGRVLLVLVLSSGTVERHDLEVDSGVDEDVVARASDRLSMRLVGTTPNSVPEQQPVGDKTLDGLVRLALQAIGAEPENGQVYVGGAANMAGQFEAIETVREVLTILEHQLMVVSMVRDLIDRGLSVAIGSETGLPLADCSVVVSPLIVDGEQAGSVGVLGPTRMDYPRALAAVQVVSNRLGVSLAAATDDH